MSCRRVRRHHRRTLTLYARAHAGEDVEVRAGSGRAWGDGHHVYLPEQVEVFGDVMFAPGPWPEDLLPWEPGAPDWLAAYERENAEAHALPTRAERTAALKRVEKRFGGVPPTSRTMATYAGQVPLV